MKILLTGGGSGGHFYPIIAIAEELQNISKEKRLLPPDLYFMSDSPYDSRLLFKNEINFIPAPAGKLRRYFSVRNFFDIFKTALGVLLSLWQVFKIFPDVVFGKGGYASFPALFAARLFRIPVIIHESDSVPGRVNIWAGKFAKTVAVSYEEAAQYFSKSKVVHTGNPIRSEILKKAGDGAFEFLNLEKGPPVLLVLGGSQGAAIFNDTVLDALSELVKKYQIIHQTGKDNFDNVSKRSTVILEQTGYKERYLPFAYLNDEAMTMAAGAAAIVLSRAGSTIFEIAAWGLPSIIVPISDSNGNHQRQNAFNYARTGAALVIEETNFGPHILIFEINRMADDQEKLKKMSKAATEFARFDAARKIALELLDIGLLHDI